MEDQGKRLMLAVGIAFALMLAWQFIFPSEKEQKPPVDETTAEGAGDGPAGDGPAGDGPAGEPTPPVHAGAEPVERGAEQVLTFEFDRFTAKLSNYGGALTSWTLSGDAFEDRSETGKPPMNLVKTSDEESWRPLTVWFASSTYGIPEQAEWTPSNRTETTIDFTWQSKYLKIVKQFEFKPDHYLLLLTVDVTVLADGEAKQTLAISTFGFQQPGDSGGGGFGAMGAGVNRAWEAQCYLAGGEIKAANTNELTEGDKGQSGQVRWVGFGHGYFLAAMSPRNDKKETLGCGATALGTRDGAMEMTLFYPQLTLERGEGYKRTVTAYFGPKFMDDLEAVTGVVGYETSFGAAVDLGMLSFICRPLLWLLKTFHDLAGNWGIAIILLTLVVQVVMLPMTAKSMRSMKAMANLRPQMDKIKAKYPDDKQRVQVETMNLYKAHKINPLAGCLPMVLQMPIWFALYRALGVAAELYQVPFIPGWLDDLTSPDPLYIMPVLLLGAMFMQTKLQPNPVESTQQKIMMYGMPLMFGFFSLMFPSGLTLYILTNTIIRTGHQHYLNRKDSGPKDEQAVTKRGVSDSIDDPAAPLARSGTDTGAAQPQNTRGQTSQGQKGQSKSKKKRSGKSRKTGGRAAKA